MSKPVGICEVIFIQNHRSIHPLHLVLIRVALKLMMDRIKMDFVSSTSALDMML